MKKLNTLFTENTKDSIDEIESNCMNSKSEIGRAAMNIGLSMLESAKLSMTDGEFYSYVTNSQDIDKSKYPTCM